MAPREYVTADRVRAALKLVYRQDPEANLHTALMRALANDLRPVDDKGRWKPSPLLILVVLLAAALGGVFLLFTVGGYR